jgi:hypothetical protein
LEMRCFRRWMCCAVTMNVRRGRLGPGGNILGACKARSGKNVKLLILMAISINTNCKLSANLKGKLCPPVKITSE